MGAATIATSAALRSRRLAAADRRSGLLAAAAPLFAERGYAGTRLEDVAAAAGVTKPIVYRHFDSKKALYIALLRRHQEDLPGFIDYGLERGGDESLESLLAAIFDHWFEYVRVNQHAWKMLFRDSSGDEEIRLYRAAVSRRAREVIAEFIASYGAGSSPPDHVAPMAELLTSGLAGLALWWIDNPEAEKAAMVEVATQMAAPAFA